MRAAMLALLYGVSGLFSLVNAAWPFHPDSPVLLALTIGVIGIGLGGAIWWRGGRLSDGEVNVALLVAAALIGVLASQSMTRAGVVALGPIVITVLFSTSKSDCRVAT